MKTNSQKKESRYFHYLLRIRHLPYTLFGEGEKNNPVKAKKIKIYLK